tara:strand:+ start:11575 stop:11988 length:414 start_codon:yes stop_codon:yes gene_type:complete
MADLTITASDVVPPSTGVADGTAGEAIVAGQAVYLDSTDDSKVKLADADDTEAKAAAVGIAVNSAPKAGQPVSYVTLGDLTVTSGVTVGEIYVVSGTAGGVAPEGDLASSDYVTILGIGKTSTSIAVKVHVSGIQVP